MRNLSSFAVLGHSAITNTGLSKISGNVGISGGTVTSVTGITTGVISGFLYTNVNELTKWAHADLALAKSDASLHGNGTPLSSVATDMTLISGVYSSGELDIAASTVLTLNAQFDSNAYWVFNINTTLILGSNAVVKVTNSAVVNSTVNVWWNVGTSATLGSGSSLVGVVMAQTSITAALGCSAGALLAHDAAVTLDTDKLVSYALSYRSIYFTLSAAICGTKHFPQSLPNTDAVWKSDDRTSFAA
eukprot:gene33820-41722_t